MSDWLDTLPVETARVYGAVLRRLEETTPPLAATHQQLEHLVTAAGSLGMRRRRVSAIHSFYGFALDRRLLNEDPSRRVTVSRIERVANASLLQAIGSTDRSMTVGGALLDAATARALRWRSPAMKRSVRRALSAADSNPAYVTDTVYAPFGPMVGMAFGNGTVERVQLDGRYRPAEYFLYGPTGATLQDTVYAEDATGNITIEADTLSPAYSQSFTYDDMNRLTAASTGTNTTLSGPTLLSNVMPYHVATYQYDPMGNMLSSTVGTRALTFQYTGTTSKLQKVLGTGSKLDVGSVTYDGAGNESAVGTQSYVYSARNLMSSASGPAYGLNASALAIGSFSYEYDGSGQRLVTRTPKGARYTIPGYTMTGPLTESSTTSPASAYDYIYFGNLPVASASTSGTSYSFTDHLGTPTIQTNAAGAITYQADLDPFGGVYDLRSGNTHQPLRRPGQVAEQFEAGANGTSDLSYNNERWFRPQWGRYTQSDPIGLIGGDNTYAYVGDEPQNAVDPSGLCRVIERFAHIDGFTNYYHSDLTLWEDDGTPYYFGALETTPLYMNSNYANKDYTGFGLQEFNEIPFDLAHPSGGDDPQAILGPLNVVEYKGHRGPHHPGDVFKVRDDRKGPCDCARSKLNALRSKVLDGDIPYNIFLYDSNTWNDEALRALGLDIMDPPDGVLMGAFHLPGIR